MVKLLRIKFREKLRFSRNKLIILLLVAFSIYILISTFASSITTEFGFTQPAPEFQSDPQEVNFPNADDGFNLSQFEDPPDGLNPPSDWLPPSGGYGDLTDIENLPTGTGSITNVPTNPTSLPSVPTNLPTPPEPSTTPDPPTEPTNPTTPSSPPTTPTKPTSSTTSKNGGDGDDANQNDGNSVDLPNRGNKARNLWNLSEIEFFPDTIFSFKFSGNFPTYPPITSDNLVFAMIILSLLYLPKSVITRLIAETKKDDEEENASSLFITPDVEVMKKKEERERRRRLVFLSDHLEEIISSIKMMRGSSSPEEIMLWTYYEIDKAFDKFTNLRRDPSLTPLEHAHTAFENHEIDNNHLEAIVDLFYLTRFGNRRMEEHQIDDLIDHIKLLVLAENKNETDQGSRWRFI